LYIVYQNIPPSLPVNHGHDGHIGWLFGGGVGAATAEMMEGDFFFQQKKGDSFESEL